VRGSIRAATSLPAGEKHFGEPTVREEAETSGELETLVFKLQDVVTPPVGQNPTIGHGGSRGLRLIRFTRK
jgi:hypothetical protein